MVEGEQTQGRQGGAAGGCDGNKHRTHFRICAAESLTPPLVLTSFLEVLMVHTGCKTNVQFQIINFQLLSGLTGDVGPGPDQEARVSNKDGDKDGDFRLLKFS